MLKQNDYNYNSYRSDASSASTVTTSDSTPGHSISSADLAGHNSHPNIHSNATATTNSNANAQTQAQAALRFLSLFTNDFGPAALLFLPPTLGPSLSYGENANECPGAGVAVITSKFLARRLSSRLMRSCATSRMICPQQKIGVCVPPLTPALAPAFSLSPRRPPHARPSP